MTRETLKKFIADKKTNEKAERQKKVYERELERELDFAETKLQLERMLVR